MALIDVIKYEGGNNILVWKHPCEDFNTSAQLIVHQTQEAIVFKDGQASEPYGPGKHTIQTENIPGIRRIVGLATGGVSPNHYDVYFVNKSYCMNIYWGTQSPWQLQDPTFELPFNVRARGQIATRVFDTRLLIQKLVGTTTSFSNYDIEKYFGGIMTTRVKEGISRTILDKGIGFSTVAAEQGIIEESVKGKLDEILKRYGLCAEEFIIEDISIVEDKYLAIVKDAQAERAKNIITGYSEREREGMRIAGMQASNPGMPGQMGGIFTGISAGAAMAPVMGNIMKGAMQPIVNSTVTTPQQTQQPDQFSMGATKRASSQQQTVKCSHCGSEIAKDSRFCPQCGKPVAGAKKTCANCGAEVPGDSKFCNQCGKAV